MVKIEAYHDGEMWCARGLGVDVFTQGETFDELLANSRGMKCLTCSCFPN